MHSFLRKTIGVMIIALLLASVLMTPASSRAGNSSETASQTGQTSDGLVRVYNTQSGALNFVRFPLERVGGYQAATSAEALTNFAGFANEFGITDESKQLRYTITQKTQGIVAYRYQQVYEGVPVFGGELRMIYNANNQLTAISGEVSTDLQLSVVPKYDSALAAQQAMSYVSKNTNVPMAYLQVTAPKLMIYDASLVSPYTQPKELVWMFEVTSLDSSPVRYVVLINAHIHSISLAFNQVDTFWSDQNPRAHTLATTTDPIETIEVADLPIAPTGSSMWSPHYNATSKTYNSNNTSSRQGNGASTLVCTDIQPTTVTLTGPNSCNGSGATPASDANAAQFFAIKTHDYFDLYHDRNSVDDNGLDLISNVKYTDAQCGNPCANAFWDGTQMTYGNDGFFAGDDVVTHELAHGVTEFTSFLFYYYESGAINEALSDIFGEYNDLINGTNSLGTGPDGIAVGTDGNAWLMGEDLTIGAIRDMENPPTFGDPDRTRAANYWTSAADNGGVHINSGVVNKTAYLMTAGGTFNGVTVTRLGTNLENSIELSSQIWYAVEYLLTSGSDFQVLDQALVAACEGLVNVTVPGTTEKLTAADCVEVSQATDATQLHLEPSAAGFSPEATLGCTDSTDTIQNLFHQDFESNTSGFSFVNVSGFGNWVRIPDYAYGGESSLWGEDVLSSQSYARLTSAVALTGGVQYFLYFKHAFGFEENYDGGTIEYSTNGGSSWISASGLPLDGRAYGGTITSAGVSGFIGDSHGYNSTRYNLTSLAGLNVLFRWRIFSDSTVQDLGWLLDDVRVYRCVNGGGVPEAPTLLGPTHRTHTNDRTPTFLWSAVANAQSYRIFIYNETRSYEEKTRVFDNYYTPSINLPIQKYLWRVRTQDNTSGLWSAWSARWTLFVD